MFNKIYKEIKKNDKIVIARHVGPDPDALGSSLGLKEAILNTFPDKKVYVVGNPANKFKYMGSLDTFNESMYDALLIVTDTPDKKRVDGVDVNKFKNVIKIDHHPFIEKMGELEIVDVEASSASQIVVELILNTKLKQNDKAAELLYIGVIADTNRFFFKSTTPKTFYLVSKLLENTSIDITKIYEQMYMRPFKEIKFQGYMFQNVNITENGVGYIKVTEEIQKEFNIDPATPGNMVNSLNSIEEITSWVTFSYDKDLGTNRVSIRSRGPIINDIAANFGGGGHIYASGVRIKTEEEMDELIKQLDNRVKEYKTQKDS